MTMMTVIDRGSPVRQAGADALRKRGSMAHHAGLAAESAVARDYERRGFPVLCQRWRGRGGEIDLVLRDGDGLILVEVKKSSGFARAAQRVSPRQMARLHASADEFLGTQPNGSLTDLRFDVALIDATGAIEILENAFAYC